MMISIFDHGDGVTVESFRFSDYLDNTKFYDMKYLKYLVGILILLPLIFFLRGLVTPSVSYDSSLTIDRPVSEVWSVMQDEATLPDWIEGYQRSEHVSGVRGEVGGVSHVYVEQGGQESMMKETITELIPNQKMAMLFSMDFMDMDYEMILEDQGSQTLITSRSVTRGNGLFAKSMVSWMKGGMKKQEDKNMAKLKSLVEGR